MSNDWMVRAAVAFALCAAGWVAAAADLKIGFVNTERVLRESAPALRAFQKLSREFEKREADLKRLDQQLRDQQATYDRNNATMSEVDRKNKERELSNLARDYARVARTFQDDVNQRKNEEVASLQERANKVIQQIADVEKFDLILQEPVVWASPRIDITDRVIKALADK
jgi:outer membrane protein